MNHKEARYFYAIFLENGIIPAPDLVEEMTKEGAKYNYLRYLVDPANSLVFKYINSDDSSYFKLSEFESDSKAQALANLYLSAQIGTPYDLYDYHSDPMILGISEASPKRLFEETQRQEETKNDTGEDAKNKPKTLAQMKKRDYLKRRRYN